MTALTPEEVLRAADRPPTLDEVLADLEKSELEGYKIPVQYGPMSAYRIILAFQSVARQPATHEDERAALRVIGDHIATAFAGNDVLAASIEAGWK